MTEDRNIAEEFAQARKDFINKKPEARPYNINLHGDNQVTIDFLESHGIHPKASRFVRVKTYPSGARDVAVSNLELGYAIRNPARAGGIKIMPDSLVVDISDTQQARFSLDLFHHICEGKIKFATFKTGAYGAVGIQPTITTVSGEITRPDLCVKYFNYAFPFSLERWQQSLSVHDKVGERWNLSGVTGLGNYIALRFLNEEGVPVPKVYLATSELLVQQYIDGYTIAEIKDQYETLKASGVLGDDDTIIDGIWDFADEYIPKLTQAAEKTIEPIRHNYWSPDFQHYDINWGNVMITKEGLRDPKHNYFVIDPIR